jgi:hypothetical protein
VVEDRPAPSAWSARFGEADGGFADDAATDRTGWDESALSTPVAAAAPTAPPRTTAPAVAAATRRDQRPTPRDGLAFGRLVSAATAVAAAEALSLSAGARRLVINAATPS